MADWVPGLMGATKDVWATPLGLPAEGWLPIWGWAVLGIACACMPAGEVGIAGGGVVIKGCALEIGCPALGIGVPFLLRGGGAVV